MNLKSRLSDAGLWVRMILIGGIAAFVVLSLVTEPNSSKKPIDPENLVSGLWWNIDPAGARTSLELARSSHKATLKAIKSGVMTKKEGTWKIAPTSIPVVVEVKLGGVDGDTILRLELVDTVSDYFLAPVPANSALLKDSWIIDRDPLDE